MADMTKIFVNGKEVNPNQLDDLPEAARLALADANKNGVPDVLENIWQHPFVQKALEKAGQRDGVVYTNFDQLPAKMREPLEKLMGKLGGVGASSGSASSAMPPARPVDWTSIEQPEMPKSVSLRMVILAVALIAALMIAAWIFFLAMRSA